jgi:hypothetical protein
MGVGSEHIAWSDLLNEPAFPRRQYVLLLLEEVVLDPKGQSVHDDGHYHDDQDEFEYGIGLDPP